MLKRHYLLPLLLTSLLIQGCSKGGSQSSSTPAASVGVDATVTSELTTLFNEVLGRLPTSAELSTYEAMLTNGTTLSQIRTDLASSTEAQQDVEAIVTQVLGAPNSTAANLLLSQLSTSVSLSQLAALL